MTELPDIESQTAKIEKLLALLPQKQRAETASILAENDAESLHLLTNIISREHANRRTRALLLLASGTVMTIGPFLSLSSPDLPWYLGISPCLGMLLLALSPFTGVPTALEKAAVETVVLSGDKRSIGALLETLQIPGLPPALRKQSKQVLIDLLQSLTAEDADLLTPVQQGQLYRNLNYIQRDSEREMRLATLTALEQIGDQHCLGVIYMLAEGDAATHTAQMVRDAARTCIERIGARLDFGPVTRIPEYTDSLIHQMQSEGLDHQIAATCVLALRQLLPQLQPANYHTVLSERHRDRLYLLLTLPLMIHQDRYGINEVQEEVLRTAHRLADTRALAAVRKIANVQAPNPAARQLRMTACETLSLLEAQVERERESKTLLRGASSPVVQAVELLRAAAPAESMIAENELLRASVPQPDRVSVRIELPSEQNKSVLFQRTEDPLS